MTGKTRPEVWVVIGPLDPDKLPAGCRAKEVPPELLDQLKELLRLTKEIEAKRRRP